MTLVLDTGPVLALLDRADPHHAQAVSLVEGTAEALAVVDASLVEIDYWVRKRLTLDVWRVFCEDVRDGAYLLERTEPADLIRTAELESTYADLELGFVDAAVIVACERLGEEKVATFDHRHFSVVRPKHCERLRLLPEPAARPRR